MSLTIHDRPAPTLSIIIPTHKRPEILVKCLEAIARQTIVKHLEVIVVSDGKDDKTARLFDKETTQSTLKNPLPDSMIRFFDIPKSHQGTARNRGVEIATAPIVLFIGDDILLAPDACSKHVEAHALLNKKTVAQEAVLGFTTWDPTLTITPVMHYLERSGWQFGYPMIAKFKHAIVPANIQHHFSYTSHISVPLAIAKAHPFREDVNLYGWEDMEWGLRLKEAGVPLYYEPDAIAYHHHPMTLPESLKRMETLGRSAVQIEKISGLRVTPKGWKAKAYRAIAKLPTMRGKHAKAFLKGLSQ